MSGLNLSKYVGEASAALLEVKMKMSDVEAAVEIASTIHQRYFHSERLAVVHFHTSSPH